MSPSKLRPLKLLSLAAKVGAHELTRSISDSLRFPGQEQTQSQSRLAKSRLEQAKLIAETLAQLKGAAMKFGQLLSIEGIDHFPPEAIAVLSRLQASAEPVAYATIEDAIRRSLGEQRLADLKPIDPQPVAAASIGQVHRASLHGQAVAIKVQYPGARDSIDSDIVLLKRLAGTITGLAGRDIDLSSLFAEFGRVLHQEADYERELEFMREYRGKLAGQPQYQVPSPIESHSSSQVLTMTWQEGLSVDAWMKSRPSLARREKIADALLSLFCQEFFEWGLVQTDPNYANFLIASDDSLVLLDFGATLRYDDDFRRRYRQFLSHLGGLDPVEIIREAIAFDLIDADESDEAKQCFVELMLVSIEPFFASRQPFLFEDADYAKRTRLAGTRFARAVRRSPPPEKLVFLHRKLGGIFNFVRKLDVRLDLSPYWKKMVGSPLPDA